MGIGISRKIRKESEKNDIAGKEFEENISKNQEYGSEDQEMTTNMKLVKKCLDQSLLELDLSQINNEIIEELWCEDDTIVMKQDGNNNNCYVIKHGSCQTYFEDDRNQTDVVNIGSLGPGAVIGVESGIFGGTNLQTVVAKVGACILCISGQYITSANAGSFKKWIISSRQFHIAMNKELPVYEELLQSLLFDCLKDTALFNDWSEMALRDLITHLKQQQLWLLPINAILLQAGDSAVQRYLYIVCKGKIEAEFPAQRMSAFVNVVKYPFVIGEQSLFRGETHKLTFRALAPSFVLTLSKAQIEQQINNAEDDRTKKSWEKLERRWSCPEVFDNPNKIPIPIEIILLKLRNSPSFRLCSPLFIHACLENSYCALFEKDDVIQAETMRGEFQHMIQVIEGKLEWRKDERRKKDLSCTSEILGLSKLSGWVRRGNITARSKSIVLFLPISSLEGAIASFPDSSFNTKN